MNRHVPARARRERDHWGIEDREVADREPLTASKGGARVKSPRKPELRGGGDLIAPQALNFLGPFAVY